MSATSAPMNVARRPRAVRIARRSIGQPPRCARRSATWSASGASRVPASRPSASRMTRSAYAAATGSWVTITTVRPSASTTSRSRARTSRPVRVSSAPVGSSAKTTSGRVTSARAIATRCCWPPESWEGRWRRRFSSPTRAATSRTSPRRSAAAVQPQRQRDVLRDRERGQEVEGLEDEADPLAPQDRQPPLAESGQVGVAERDGAGGGTVEPRGDVQERALARARRAHDRGERPARKLDADAVERDDGAVALAVHLADVAQRDRGGGGWSLGSPASQLDHGSHSAACPAGVRIRPPCVLRSARWCEMGRPAVPLRSRLESAGAR